MRRTSPDRLAGIESALVQCVGLIGFGTFIAGVWLMHRPAALIVGGALLVGWTVMKVRSE